MSGPAIHTAAQWLEAISSGFIVLLAAAAAAVAGLCAYLLLPLRFPLPTESDYTHRSNPWWQLYYAHKYLRPIRRAARGSGLEEHFREQNFDFSGREPLSERNTVTISATGDLMARSDLDEAGSRELWSDVGERVFDADLVIGNQEFSVNEQWLIDDVLRYSVPPEQARPLLGDPRFGRFDVLSLANNHINDSLSGGIERSITHAQGAGILPVGACIDPVEREKVNIVERNGIKIAILAYTFSTNDVPLEEGFEHSVNVVRFNALQDADYDPSLIHRHIARARELGADLIVSLHHWGLDMEHYPPPRIVERAHALLERGVDIIIGHHPHVVSPAERYRTRDGRDCLVFYSLGSLTTKALLMPVQRLSDIVRIEIESGRQANGDRIVRPCGIEITPAYHSVQRRGPVVEHRIIPVVSAVRSILENQALECIGPDDVRILPKLLAIHERYRGSGILYR
jgi:poly-gamma-glutamate synthesis protein (capsule biosynthesis protein)